MNDTRKSEIGQGLHNSHGSFELVLSPLILALLGWWLDSAVGTSPVFTVVGTVLGLVGAVVKLYVEYGAAMAGHASAGRSSRADRAAADAPHRDLVDGAA